MIISHKYKFILLHSRRTGGNSFSLYFNKFAGADDLIVESWSEILSSGGRTNKEARSRLLRNLGNPQLLASTLRSAGSPAEALNYSNYISFHGEQKLGPNPAHTSAQMVSKMFPTEFDTYFKFAFFRNPYSFVLSDYAKRRHKLEQQGADFSSYLEAMGTRMPKKKVGGAPRQFTETEVELIEKAFYDELLFLRTTGRL